MNFSIAMSVYKNDNPVYFARALRSITEDQTVKPNEIVLVVDGPISQQLDAVIAGFDNICSLKIIRLKENKGLGNALKLALENCSNEIVARMDSDDVSLPKRFEEQLGFFLEHPDVDILGSDISEFRETEDEIVDYRRVPVANDDIKKYIKKRCPLNHMTVMYKKTAVIRCGNYVDLFNNEDYFLWVRMLLHNSVMANTGTVLVKVRIGKDMYRRRGGKEYYASEKYLQKYMLKYRVISLFRYCDNIAKRWIMQCLLPTGLRSWAFRTFARSKR